MIDIGLARKIEQAEAIATRNYAVTQQQLDPGSGACWRAIGDGMAAYTGQNSPVGKVIGLGMLSSVSPADVADIIDFYHSRETAAIVYVCPLADHSLLSVLATHGFTIDSQLTVVVGSNRAAERERCDTAFTVATPDLLPAWATTVSGGFAGTDHPSPSDREIAHVIAHTPGTRCVLALIDGEPVAGAALHVDTEPAYLHSMSTRVGFRRRSIQVALIGECQRIVAEAGCKLLTAQDGTGIDLRSELPAGWLCDRLYPI